MRRRKLEEFTERFSGPFEAVAKQYAHNAVAPEETRTRLIQALEMLSTKKEDRPRKKHGLMPV
jgi:propionyl-CoA carboxylase beta chain